MQWSLCCHLILGTASLVGSGDRLPHLESCVREPGRIGKSIRSHQETLAEASIMKQMCKARIYLP